MEARVHRIPANAPDDVAGLKALIDNGTIDPAAIVAILGKTEGNGCVNDFSRGFATATLKSALAGWTGRSQAELERSVVFVMSGGTEGGLSPHWLVFEARMSAAPANGGKALAIGAGMTRPFAPHEIGRMAQIEVTAEAVRTTMQRAGIAHVEDVHYVQIKCPLLTKARVVEAKRNRRTVVTEDSLKSMGYSRGASALGVALALGEVTLENLTDAMICQDSSFYSRRAATSAGVELMENQILVVGNSPTWSGDLVIDHDMMSDAIDTEALARVLDRLGIVPRLPIASADQERLIAVLTKAEPAANGLIRGSRHIMLDDSDISATRHARSLVGGVLAGVLGTTQLFVSGGAEHQGPDGGGPIAIIARKGR